MFSNQLEFSFMFYHKPETEITLHHHNCYELVYYITGSGATTIGNVEYAYEKNTFSLIRPQTGHSEIHHEATELLCIGFKLNNSASIHLENGVYPDRSSLLMQLVNKLKHELLSQRLYYQLKVQLLLNEFLVEIERMRSARSFLELFEYTENYINENFNQDIDLPSLAKITGYSYDHFRHIFKDKTGESPLSYIINKRIEHAKKLMLSTDLTMSAISQDCGFSNSSQFSSTFRKLTGLTPSDFKRSHFIQ
ncbi:helix-turn-helix domain-containing protein [Paenibacillus sp. GCM10027626]|uniref:helix-turn-helix transcriptional regulator n=1 Tax=Paenibacillus sp. GCM10027626 TaxID=3273411 RepID=UPI00364260CC